MTRTPTADPIRRVSEDMTRRGLFVSIRPSSVDDSHYIAEVFDRRLNVVHAYAATDPGRAFVGAVESIPFAVLADNEPTS